jgi:hypothetical protein
MLTFGVTFLQEKVLELEGMKTIAPMKQEDPPPPLNGLVQLMLMNRLLINSEIILRFLFYSLHVKLCCLQQHLQEALNVRETNFKTALKFVSNLDSQMNLLPLNQMHNYKY